MSGKLEEEAHMEDDLESVEARIRFTRDDYRLLTSKIQHCTMERSRLETVIRKLEAVAYRIKNWQEDEDI
jgi:hypothetical protein